MNFYNIKNISIGNKQIKGILAGSNKEVASMPVLKNHGAVGILGANIMLHSIWQINYRSKEITITDKFENLQLPCDAHIVKMKHDELSRPHITVIIAGKYKVDFIVDVAFNGSLLLPDRFFSKPVFNDSLTYSKQVNFSAGFGTQTKQMEYRFLQYIIIGDMKLENVMASSSGNNSIALIGNAFLEKYTIIMDYVNKNIAFLPIDEKSKMPCC